MSTSLLCRIGRHQFLTHHNHEDGKPSHQQCARCGKIRYRLPEGGSSVHVIWGA